MVLFSLCLINASATAGWQTETVDSEVFVSPTSLAFDASGHPAIVYGGSKFARFNGISWDITTFGSGKSTSLAFDASGNPAISFTAAFLDIFPLIRTEIRYAHFNGTSWDITTIDTTFDFVPQENRTSSSLAFDALGNPAISYNPGELDALGNPAILSGLLKFARFNGTSWDITDVEPGGLGGEFSSLAFDASGNPAIAYQGFVPSMKFARFNGVTWDITTVDPVGSDPSLAFDPLGNPAIAYRGGISLKYAHFNGTTWNITTADSAFDVGRFASLAFDATGNPSISYYDGLNNNLKFARFNGTSWDIITVDSEGRIGWNTSLAFDALGNPAISYNDFINNDLKFARFVPEDCTNGIDDDSDGLVDCNDPECPPCPTCQCPTPTGCVSGRLTDSSDQPLVGKIVRLKKKPSRKPLVRDITDSNGCYSFTGLEDGTYVIWVKRCRGGGKRNATVVGINNGAKINGLDFQCK